METNLNPQGLNENNIVKNIEPKLVKQVTRTELIEREIIFDAPKKDVVLKVINIQNEIETKDIKVANGNVLVSGYLSSCIMYTTMKRPQSENNNNEQKNNENENNSEKHGYVNMQNNNNNNNNNNKNNENSKNNKNKNKEKAKPSCGIVDIDNNIALDGVVRHTTVWIPFKAFIPDSEAQEGDIGLVTSSSVLSHLESNSIEPIYEDEYDEESTVSIMRDEEEQKFIKGIVNKALIELTVDIKRYPKI